MQIAIRRVSSVQVLTLLIVATALTSFAGCPAAPSARQVYEAAKQEVDKEQAELDRMLPGYTAAKQTALVSVTKELAGSTSEESLKGTLGQLDSMSKALQENQQDSQDIKPGDLDAKIDQLVATQGDTLKQINALTSAAGKAAEAEKKISTPGTPENRRYEDVLAKMPEVQAYQRQEQRLEKAKQAMKDAEAKLPTQSAK